MTKIKSLLIMLLCLLPLLAACGSDKTTSPAYSEPPLPTITVGVQQVTVVRGSSCWAAKGTGRCVDMIPPDKLLQNVEPTVAPTGSEVKIGFDYAPIDLTVNLWSPDSAQSNVVLQDQTVTLPMKSGTYIYDISAHWKEGSSNFSFKIAVSAKAAQGSGSPEQFLQSLPFKVVGEPAKWSVQVPSNWNVKAGEYPEGLYWNVANVFSKDAGYDLWPLRGETVDVLRYSLTDGLPGEGEHRSFQYPSNLIVLVQSGKVVGTWLEFNKSDIGPSVKRRSLQGITGFTFEQWVEQAGIFADTGEYSSLSELEPTELLAAFLKAIDEGDKAKAYACLSPDTLLQSLVMNLADNRLYNPNFAENNSFVDNILAVKSISYKILDPQTHKEIKQAGDRPQVEIEANLTMKWKKSAFNSNSSDGNVTRYVTLQKYSNGWKVLGLGSGP